MTLDDKAMKKLVDRMDALRHQIKTLTEQEKGIKEEIQEYLEAHGGDRASVLGSHSVVTLKVVETERLDTKAIKAEHPGKYLIHSSYKRLDVRTRVAEEA